MTHTATALLTGKNRSGRRHPKLGLVFSKKGGALHLLALRQHSQCWGLLQAVTFASPDDVSDSVSDGCDASIVRNRLVLELMIILFRR